MTLEITETAAIGDLGAARAFAEAMAGLGCGIALDDFGAGFASLSYLKHLPFDELKIDGEFVRGLPTSATDQLLVPAIVSVTRGLGKRTVGECVENAETGELLKHYGVDRAQGFHFGVPRPAAEALTFR